MVSFLIVATLLNTLIGVSGVVLISRPGVANSTPVTYAVLGFTALGLKILRSMLQAEFARRQITQKVDVAVQEMHKTNIDVMHAVQEVKQSAAEVKHATNGGL